MKVVYGLETAEVDDRHIVPFAEAMESAELLLSGTNLKLWMNVRSALGLLRLPRVGSLGRNHVLGCVQRQALVLRCKLRPVYMERS